MSHIVLRSYKKFYQRRHSQVEEEKIMQISCKLNPVYDMEIIEAIRKIPKRDRSRAYREALKEYFKKQKTVENQ